MDVKRVEFVCCIVFLLVSEARLQEPNEREIIDGHHGDKGCAYLHCEGNDTCVHRKFRCKEPPCPGMLYCAKTRTESLRGPSTCDTVQCTMGYICMLKVRRCHWDNKCEQQVARCVPRKEYFEGPASCAGFKCPQGNHCILRESFCAHPPCKLLRSCAKNKDVQFWFGRCRNLGCRSEYECFLRRPDNNCTRPPCKHTPDCVRMNDDETTDEHCRGWICPRFHTCVAEVVGFCDSDDCTIERTCNDARVVPPNDTSLSFSRRSLKEEEEVEILRIQTTTPTSKMDRNGIEEKTPHTIPRSWLDHLNSKTELDAIELWIKNADKQSDFEQFQDWLRSVRDILGPVAYSDWLEGIWSSRGEEFRKWLRASHAKPDVGQPIFPGREGPSDLTENPYPGRNVVNVPSGGQNVSFTDGEDSISQFEEKPRSVDDITVDLLKQVIETLLLQSFDSRYMEHHHRDHSRSDAIAPKNENSKENRNEVSFDVDDTGNIGKHQLDTWIDVSRDLDDIQSELPLKQTTDYLNDAMDLNRSVAKEKLLHHIETLMEISNGEDYPSGRNSDGTVRESSLSNNFFQNNHRNRANNEFPHDSMISKTGPPDVYGAKHARNPQEKDSRTPGIIYSNGESTIRSFYNLPSYGANDDRHIAVQDFIYDEYNRMERKGDNQVKPHTDYANAM